MNIQTVTAAYGSKLYDVKRSDSTSVPTNGTDVKKEKVEISKFSSQLHKLKSIVDNTPEVRLEVVKEIIARIKVNDYPIENNLDEALKKMIKSRVLKP